MRVARRRVEDLHGAVRATLLADLDDARAGASMSHGFPVFPQGLDLAKPAMYLSWTGDVPVVYVYLVPLRMGWAARRGACRGRSFSARPSPEPRLRLSAHVAL